MKLASRKFGIVALVGVALVVLGGIGRGRKTHAQPPLPYPNFPATASALWSSCAPGPTCFDCAVGAPTAGCTNGAQPGPGYTGSDCQGGGWAWQKCTGT